MTPEESPGKGSDPSDSERFASLHQAPQMAGAGLWLPQNRVNISKEKYSGIDVEMKGAHPSYL
jgi:hypothetical protein